VGGRLLAKRISARTVTIVGGVLFLIFGLMSIVAAWMDVSTSEKRFVGDSNVDGSSQNVPSSH
jgi:hypothetical protein